MSDFLTRVAERALGVAPMVEPRMPGLFGPIEAQADATRAPLDPREPDRAPVERGPAAPLEAPGSTQTPPPAGEEPRAARAARETLADPPRPGRSPRAVPGGERLVRFHDQPVAFEPGEPMRARHTSGAEGPGGDGTDASELPDARHVSRATGRGRPARVVPIDPLVPVTEARHDGPPEHGPVLAAAARALSGEQGPTVRITIGRVEVRASVPATPPRLEHTPPAADPQRLSLAEYLKRGSHGGAR